MARQSQTTTRPVSGFHANRCSKILWFVLLGTVCRFGEADHPGPSNDECWQFGIANPTGLSRKLDHIAHQSGHTWVFSETHLTRHGLRKLRSGLKALKSPYTGCVSGAPCPDRLSIDAGEYAGVLMLNKGAARVLPSKFDAQQFALARHQAAGMQAGPLWFQVGMVYGFPTGHTHASPAAQTNEVLAEVVERIGCQTTGYRIVCGDINHEEPDLAALQKLTAWGFREAQTHALMTWGKPQVPTGRGQRKLDQIWISPELLPLVRDVTIDRER